jgi:hypothetical protein
MRHLLLPALVILVSSFIQDDAAAESDGIILQGVLDLSPLPGTEPSPLPPWIVKLPRSPSWRRCRTPDV